jgi:hypothetical protein
MVEMAAKLNTNVFGDDGEDYHHRLGEPCFAGSFESEPPFE